MTVPAQPTPWAGRSRAHRNFAEDEERTAVGLKLAGKPVIATASSGQVPLSSVGSGFDDAGGDRGQWSVGVLGQLG
ncbi:MAG: hypothetical protein ACRDTD_23445, partial [Pseudonocardiaceae bacterium]